MVSKTIGGITKMNKFEALEEIKNIWNDSSTDLGTRIRKISNSFYSVGLDLSTTAAYIRVTPAELDALLALGALDDDLIDMISKVNPPETTWQLIANASTEEAKQALDALAQNKTVEPEKKVHSALSQFVYSQMLELSGPTPEQIIGMLSSSDLFHLWEKGKIFNVLSNFEIKFLASVAGQRKRGKTLSSKQISTLISILKSMIEKKVIIRNSIDGDSEICNKILDALE